MNTKSFMEEEKIKVEGYDYELIIKRWKSPNGKLHRENGPAVIEEVGCVLEKEEYWINDELHRENGPAVIHEDGTKYWYYRNKLHRIDGPAAIETDGGDEEYNHWYFQGKLHRIDGPAIDYVGGEKYWYIDGYEYTEEVYDFIIKRRRKNAKKYLRLWFDITY